MANTTAITVATATVDIHTMISAATTPDIRAMGYATEPGTFTIVGVVELGMRMFDAAERVLVNDRLKEGCIESGGLVLVELEDTTVVDKIS